MIGIIAWTIIIVVIVMMAKLLSWWWRKVGTIFATRYRFVVYIGSLAVWLFLVYVVIFPMHIPVRNEIHELCESEGGVWINERAPEKVDGFLSSLWISEIALLEAGYSFTDRYGILESGEHGKYRRSYLGTNEGGGWAPIDVIIEEPSRYEVITRAEPRSRLVEAYVVEIQDRQTGKIMGLSRRFNVRLDALKDWEKWTQWWVKSIDCELPRGEGHINLIEEVLPPSGPKFDFRKRDQLVIKPKIPEAVLNQQKPGTVPKSGAVHGTP